MKILKFKNINNIIWTAEEASGGQMWIIERPNMDDKFVKGGYKSLINFMSKLGFTEA